MLLLYITLKKRRKLVRYDDFSDAFLASFPPKSLFTIDEKVEPSFMVRIFNIQSKNMSAGENWYRRVYEWELLTASPWSVSKLFQFSGAKRVMWTYYSEYFNFVILKFYLISFEVCEYVGKKLYGTQESWVKHLILCFIWS